MEQRPARLLPGLQMHTPPPRQLSVLLPDSSMLPDSNLYSDRRLLCHEGLRVQRKSPVANSDTDVYYLVYTLVTPVISSSRFRLRSLRCHVYSYANNSVVATVRSSYARKRERHWRDEDRHHHPCAPAAKGALPGGHRKENRAVALLFVAR